jgi:hypothetical protein
VCRPSVELDPRLRELALGVPARAGKAPLRACHIESPSERIFKKIEKLSGIHVR